MRDPADIQTFIDRWQDAGASERANAQLFLIELADLRCVLHIQRAAEDSNGII